MNKLIHSSLLTVIIAIAAYGIVIGVSDSKAIFDAVFSLGWPLWTAILLLSLGNYLLRFLRWAIYLRHDIPEGLSTMQHLIIYLAGFALAMTPGKAGEMLRCFYLNRYGMKNDRAMGAFLVERVVDLLVILLLASLVLGVFNVENSYWAIIGAIVAIGIAIAMLQLPLDRILKATWVKKLPEQLQKLGQFMEDSRQQAKAFLTWRYLLMGVFIGAVAWGLEGVGLFLLTEHYNSGLVTLWMAMGIYGFAMLLGALSFLPGGVGGAEAAMTFLLVKSGFGMPEAVAITFICRLATLWFAIVLGVIFTGWLSLTGLKPVLKEHA